MVRSEAKVEFAGKMGLHLRGDREKTLRSGLADPADFGARLALAARFRRLRAEDVE